jgi:hypothetical protein
MMEVGPNCITDMSYRMITFDHVSSHYARLMIGRGRIGAQK